MQIAVYFRLIVWCTIRTLLTCATGSPACSTIKFIHRLRNISTSLRTFSRADTAVKVSANICDGIDSTLMILQHRLKAQETRPEIQTIKEYGEIPPVKCYLG